MSDFQTRFMSKKQDWRTPDEVYTPLHKEFKFTLDAAASAENAKCRRYYTAADNALQKKWGTRRVWLNPPYGAVGGGRLQQWVQKAYAESLQGALVVVLIPARTNTSWFHDLCLKHGEVRFIRGRPKFGDAPHGLPQPLCIVIFKPTNRKGA